jgi:hypothetical protein
MSYGKLWLSALLSVATVYGSAHADSYPQGALAFFNTQSCPTGWSRAVDASGNSLNGFFLVPFTPPITAGMLGTTVNQAMASGEIRTHSHTFASSITLSGITWAGKAGCEKWLDLCDKNTAADGAMSFSGTTGAADSGVPYIQLLLCAKTEFNRNQNPPVGVPQYVVTFFTDTTCPTGWKQTLTTGGRFISALPQNGSPQVAFGGPVLSPGEDRTHTHAFSGSVSVGSTGVELVAGGQQHGFGGPGTYQFSGATAAASTGIPYAVVTQCQACGAGDQDPACTGQP